MLEENWESWKDWLYVYKQCVRESMIFSWKSQKVYFCQMQFNFQLKEEE